MAKLSIEQAPAPSTPRLFLLTASAWASVAGVLLLCDGAPVLASRWGGATLAMVHAFTLGFLGNAMFGSLLQFLPVAAGVRIRGGRFAALSLYGLLNLGAFALVVAFRWPQAWPAWWGGVPLLAAFVLLASLVLPGMLHAAGQRFLRCGLGGAIVAGVVTALLGLCLTLDLSGAVTMPVLPLTDAHAAWGMLGWVVALMASVARLVGPMFQGLTAPRERAQGLWHAGVYVVLVAGVIAAFRGVASPWLRISVGGVGLVFAATGLLLQMRAQRLRKAPLTGFWAAGLIALAASASLLLAGDAHAVLVGVLAIGIGLPLLVVGMQLEIVAFLGWIGLHRHCGKGVRLPGVQLLMPERDKYTVLLLHLAAAVALLIAVLLPVSAAARVAGGALLLAHGTMLAALSGVGWRSRRFVWQLQERK
ncbi:hypothetical protein N800_03790 [Lysobacter daejeonensis GH1-9]|uniref:Uncharacterized protein n=1 Tax=Lysobacter daejeonensis GH1-9 TaxID=1385517 RepID=A0A0A0EWM0_9GAMM|nr:hypothetical protein [Lysobacter daejeonensis]KGM53557.1 hypothetical protein N800_03790 [Lysobacter daejeonensis GH1-9]